jgi:hypothetical protein
MYIKPEHDYTLKRRINLATCDPYMAKMLGINQEYYLTPLYRFAMDSRMNLETLKTLMEEEKIPFATVGGQPLIVSPVHRWRVLEAISVADYAADFVYPMVSK